MKKRGKKRHGSSTENDKTPTGNPLNAWGSGQRRYERYSGGMSTSTLPHLRWSYSSSLEKGTDRQGTTVLTPTGISILPTGQPSDVLIAMCREHIASKHTILYGQMLTVTEDAGLEAMARWLAKEFEAVADLQRNA